MNRRILALIVGAAAGVSTVTPAAATNGSDVDPLEYRSTTLSANATLTDCPQTGPVGLHCTGIVVSASATSDSFGPSTASTFVQVFDVELLGGGGFATTPVGFGQSVDAKVKVQYKLGHASVKAHVAICPVEGAGQPDCVPIRIIDVSVRWRAAGDTVTEEFTDEFTMDGCTYQFQGTFVTQAATVVVTVDGQSMPNSSLAQFTPAIRSSETVQRVTCVVSAPLP